MTRVLVVDDHGLVRQGLRTAIDEAPGPCRVVAEARSAADALERLASVDVDVAIVDVVLPDLDGLQLCREIRSRQPTTACLLLTSFPERRAALSAVLAGASGYLAKSMPTSQIIDAVQAVAQGESLLESHEDVDGLLAELRQIEEHPHIGELTQQEHRVFELIGQGLTNRQIGERLHLTEKTVKNYVSRMLRKLDMGRRTEAAVLAARLAERRALRRARP